MLPLRVIFLWHYHQPDYRWEGQALLPWVRLRAVKDYAVLFKLLGELPRLRCVFNIVPSLLVQLSAYAEGVLTDVAEHLSSRSSRIPPEGTDRYWRMLQPPSPLQQRFPELSALWQRLQSGSLSPQEWIDTLMWTQLVWTFPYRQRFPVVDEWFQRGSGYRCEELQLLLQLQRLLTREAFQALREGLHQEHIELSCSPFYHPILPLLCDTESARESDPGISLPRSSFRFPADAWVQCARARQCCWELVGVVPDGLWPPEGAVSMEALHQMVLAGVRWAATDETLLFASLPTAPRVQKYLPHRIRTSAGELALFFRDRELSDAISFQYGAWESDRAVEDICQRLREIRAELVRSYGESVLRTAAVMIALDGENCWDSYPDNGLDFLRSLADRLHAEEWVTTVTCREVLAGSRHTFQRLSVLRTGSWVSASLRIWIGTPGHNAAWEALCQARELVEKSRYRLSSAQWRQALEHLLVAEGSDWFWWRSPEHPTPAAPLFERLFQLHVERARQCVEEKWDGWQREGAEEGSVQIP
ncbi:MAG: glycoside hydrolase family 57 protein [Candidatus Kapabacteria bacterium]|nr:glycoside hydrolase family 57 protein [Candidatus Kapabacteria bacterium]MDW7996996.1 glycoside hydrolase family 57 protein [Bacteroidota bacterium]